MSNIKKGVRLEGVSKIYIDPKSNKPFKAVDNIDLDIKPGDFVTLLGGQGSQIGDARLSPGGGWRRNVGNLLLGRAGSQQNQ